MHAVLHKYTAINQSKSDTGLPTTPVGSLLQSTKVSPTTLSWCLLHSQAVLCSGTTSLGHVPSPLDYREPSNHPLEELPFWLSLSLDDPQLHHAEQPCGI